MIKSEKKMRQLHAHLLFIVKKPAFIQQFNFTAPFLAKSSPYLVLKPYRHTNAPLFLNAETKPIPPHFY
ncbi:hypothetical protein HMPREF3213_04064 [Heyndrickxia coagulans]|jgi:hypothetical protein|uniref:Uncharacterized protein n=1 Tax=Heyndrickxia coagulans TaxID=1398 RepID=A0A133K991_HEYCO|nr:hypothetical protein HMPREF3213_04064 [Heyndrickxia coagulans]